MITGQDGDEANLKNIVDGVQTMTVYKNVSNESIVTLGLAEAILNGDTIDDSLTSTFGVECDLIQSLMRLPLEINAHPSCWFQT